jgi:hypothetical protein
MEKPQARDRQQLTWVELIGKPHWYELHAGDEVVGTLRWEEPFWGPAIAESADGCWTFERSGLIRVTGSESELARLRLSERRVLKFRTGRLFEWLRRTWVPPSWIWRDSGGVPVLRMEHNEVVIEAASRDVPELPLLVLLGQYLRVLQMPAPSSPPYTFVSIVPCFCP